MIIMAPRDENICPAHSGIEVGIENILKGLDDIKTDLRDSKDKQWSAINRNAKFMNRMAGGIAIMVFAIPLAVGIYEALK